MIQNEATRTSAQTRYLFDTYAFYDHVSQFCTVTCSMLQLISALHPGAKMHTSLLSTHLYLSELLPGEVSEVLPWKHPALPYFLLDAFDLAQLHVHGHPVILAASREVTPQQTLRKMLARLRGIAGCRVLYVAPHLSTYERSRLLGERVEFVVPGRQLFAPSLALSLAEGVSASAPPSEVLVLAHATQAMLISLLLSGEASTSTRTLARQLGYSPMTASRANRELEAAGLVTIERAGSASVLTLTDTHQSTWERAKPLMRTPVAKRLHAVGPTSLLRTAGETALAELTLLVHPSESVYAIGQNDWREIEAEFTIIPEADAGTFKLQVWSYRPLPWGDAPSVDPLSLILSLRGEVDERVQISLEELENSTWERLKD